MKQNIPFFSLKRQWDTIKKNILPQIEALLESNQFVGGPSVEHFEQQFAKQIGSEHAISCNSGTDALWLALKALDITPNSIILTTPFSFIASSSEIIAHHAQPVFVDIDESYNICPKKIENWLKLNAIMRNNQAFHKQTNVKIAGILTVDLFGQCADYAQIKSIANEWNLWIVEDACQAIGAHINGKKAGTFGDIACFSLYPTKNIGACGDGGALTTNDNYLAEKLFRLRNHGRKSHYNYECYGRNSRLDAIQAVIATEKLLLLDQLNNRRREIAKRYTKQLSNVSFIKTPQEIVGHHVYHQYSIQVEAMGNNLRDELQQHLHDNQIGTNIFYPKPLHEISFLIPPKEFYTECPVTKKVSQQILALPIWPELTDKEIDYVCDCIKGFVASPRSSLDTNSLREFTRDER